MEYGNVEFVEYGDEEDDMGFESWEREDWEPGDDLEEEEQQDEGSE